MNIEEARLYLEHTSKDDFNLEEWQKENRYEAIQVILQEIERLNNIINEINSIVEYWGYDKEHNDISSFRMAMKNIKDILGSDKE